MAHLCSSMRSRGAPRSSSKYSRGVSAALWPVFLAAVRRARVPIDRDLASADRAPSIRRTAASTGDSAGPRSGLLGACRVHAQSVLHIRRQLARSHARGASACGTSRSSAGREPRCARSATSPTWNYQPAEALLPGRGFASDENGKWKQALRRTLVGERASRIAAGVDVLWRDATVGLDAAVPADSHLIGAGLGARVEWVRPEEFPQLRTKLCGTRGVEGVQDARLHAGDSRRVRPFQQHEGSLRLSRCA